MMLIIYFSTGNGVLITPKHFFFFNIGDSRSFLVRSKDIFFVTNDHKPYFTDEHSRILAAGGRVQNNRVNGTLAVSRKGIIIMFLYYVHSLRGYWSLVL